MPRSRLHGIDRPGTSVNRPTGRRCRAPTDPHLSMLSDAWRYADVGPGVLRGKRARAGERNFHVASHSLASKHMVDRPAEFVRDKLADDLHAVAGVPRRRDHGSARLPPREDQPIARAGVTGNTPRDRHPARRDRKGTVLCSVGDQLVKHRGHCLAASALSITSGPPISVLAPVV
jgi:hypothetical protein